MRTLLLALVALIGLPTAAQAQASVTFQLNLPVVLPPLVVVTPGVRVVPDVDEEVFFVDGYYWVRRDRSWYRSRSHRHGWVLVGARGVPSRISGFAPGKYKRWKPAAHHDGHHRGDDHGRNHADDHGHRGGDDHGHRGGDDHGHRGGDDHGHHGGDDHGHRGGGRDRDRGDRDRDHGKHGRR
jgi:hypothetical protein